MKVFFDECVPRPLRRLLPEYEIDTAQEQGWARLKNGELIKKAEDHGYAVFMTTDQNLRYQQNLIDRRIALLILSTNFWPALRVESGKIKDALNAVQAGQYMELSI